jgi:hypothetical protein
MDDAFHLYALTIFLGGRHFYKRKRGTPEGNETGEEQTNRSSWVDVTKSI